MDTTHPSVCNRHKLPSAPYFVQKASRSPVRQTPVVRPSQSAAVWNSLPAPPSASHVDDCFGSFTPADPARHDAVRRRARVAAFTPNIYDAVRCAAVPCRAVTGRLCERTLRVILSTTTRHNSRCQRVRSRSSVWSRRQRVNVNYCKHCWETCISTASAHDMPTVYFLFFSNKFLLLNCAVQIRSAANWIRRNERESSCVFSLNLR